MYATLAQERDTGRLVKIDDMERRNGLYILGKPRMGKSWLIVSLIIQDIENGHGVFFIDPHGDGVNALRARYPLPSKCLVLDPENENYSFGINLLTCQHLENLKARNDTFAKAKGVFDKLWKNTFEEKPWLQLILQNTIYAFIENQGYTLAEFPLFFRDSQFRNYIVNNMKYNLQVKDYWLNTFAAKTRHTQQEQMEAAETRAVIMLAHPYVNDIVSQTKTTINFDELIKQKKVILIKLSAFLSYETKKIIGTILISELLTAIQHRSTNQQFCIYVDEFQTFASLQDFPILITQAPKYGIATTLAHHERYGQLLEDPMMLGATAAIVNKVLFQVTVKDAADLAPELAEAPPTETRREQELVISQNPFFDLLRGHTNPQIREFVDKHIRPLKERLEDIKGDMEIDRFVRMDFLDEANLFRIDQQIEGTHRIYSDTEAMRGALQGAGAAIASARTQTENLRSLSQEVVQLRLSIREFDRFFTCVMEGKALPGHEAFSRFLINRVQALSAIPERYKAALALYTALTYGDNNAPVAIPYSFARVLASDYGLFAEGVKLIEQQVMDQYNQQRSVEAKEAEGRHWKRLKQIDEWIGLLEIEEKAYDWKREEIQKSLSYNRQERADHIRNKRSIINSDLVVYDHLYGGKQLFENAVPDVTVRMLTSQEVNKTRAACYQELETGHITRALVVIREFADFCVLLSKPENHIMVRSGQYTEREVNLRTEADMVGEKARELIGLPKYTAYAKLLQWKGKMQTVKLRELPKDEEEIALIQLGAGLMEYNSLPYLKRRTEIEWEIRERQEAWRRKPEEQAAGHPGASTDIDIPTESEEPPSIHS